MTVALLVMTDGRREYIRDTIRSASCNLEGPFGPLFMYDDSADEANHEWLRNNFPSFKLFYKETRQGFGGAINSAWEFMKDYEFEYIFHLEDDFTFNRKIPVDDMIQKLVENPNVYQMALRRQAWNREEMRVGGVIQRWPDQFHQQNGFMTHRLFFTTNPSLYRRSLIETRTYPNIKDAEGHFTLEITGSDPNAVFGFWGDKTDPPWVNHNGVKRGKGSY